MTIRARELEAVDGITDTRDLDWTIAKHTFASFDDETPLLEAGIESLALLRLAVEVASDDSAEIDAGRIVGLRTIGDLKQWLAWLASTDRNGAGEPS